MIQAGYYTLKTLEGIQSGYVCLTYMGNQLETRIRVDKAQGEREEYMGYFTEPLATAPQGPCALTLSAATKGASCLGSGIIATQSLPSEDAGIDFTLFCQGRPCMAAQIVARKPSPEPELKAEPVLDSEPEFETETELETAPELEQEPEREMEAKSSSQSYKLQAFDPFNTTNEAYKWWICTHTDEFYQLMEDTEIVPDPPLYTALSSALSHFGHFLFGRYQEDGEDSRVLSIFGVPVSGNTPVPSQMNARWVPAQNKIAGSPNYAGYWLYYFDAETKHIVRAKLRT